MVKERDSDSTLGCDFRSFYMYNSHSNKRSKIFYVSQKLQRAFTKGTIAVASPTSFLSVFSHFEPNVF